MKYTRQKTNGMKRPMLLLPVFLVAVVTLALVAAAPNCWAEEEIPFDEASIFFELNDTDGDLGIHALIDGEPWRKLEIELPNEREILTIWVRSKLRRQGLTELFFESAEPTFDELSPEKFFRRFPEGEYEIEGITLEGDELESVVEVTHLMPAPAGNVEVNGEAVPEDCDEGPVPSVSSPVTISWNPVTLSHPDIGRTNESIEVVKYQVVVEQEDLEFTFSLDLPPDVTSVDIPIPAGLIGNEFKLEILVREESGNQTAFESCFEVE